jgi:hypothetical protein
MGYKKYQTAKEWDASDEPGRMLAFLGKNLSARKLRLFGVACCRHIKDLSPTDAARYTAAEAFAEGRLKADDLRRSWNILGPAYLETAEDWAWAWAKPRGSVCTLKRPIRATLLREIFGNPFRPAVLPEGLWTWQGGTLPRLAQAAYDEQHLPTGLLDANHLAVLADALADAGCTDPAILRHLRDSGEHMRGCWLVDLLLAKDR